MSDNLKRQVEHIVTREHLLPDDVRIQQLDKKAVPVLIDAFKTAEGDFKNLKCRQSLLALGVLGTNEAVEFMIATAQNSEVDEWLRKSAVQCLGLSTNPKAMEFLESMLSHPKFGFRKNAMLGLGASKAPSALEALESAHDTEPDERLRQRINDLLVKKREAKAIKVKATKAKAAKAKAAKVKAAKVKAAKAKKRTKKKTKARRQT
jgi:HEAT repeat protein